MNARGRLGRHATSLALLAAAVGIGAYAYFIDRDAVSDNERRRRDNDVIPAYRREEVDRVEVDRPGVASLVLERAPMAADAGDAVWMMASPRRGVADQAAVERLLSAFEFASIVRKVDPKAAAGMRAPRATGLLGMGGLTFHFALGAPSPVPEGSAYLRIDGQGTYVVTRELVQGLLEDDSVYRDRTVVPYLSLDLSGLTVSSKDGTVSLARMDGTSFLLKDRGLRASRDRLDRIWSALAEMRAEAFVEDAVADHAVAPPFFSIRMLPTDKSKPTGDLEVGGPCSGHPDDVVVVRRLPSRVSACAPKGIQDGLGTTADALVDERLFAARADEIEELRVEGLAGDERKLELARKGVGWHERAPHDRELVGDEIDAANALADGLARADGVDVRRGDAQAPFSGRARITLVRADNAGQEVVILGPREGELDSVQRTADGATLRVSSEVAGLFAPTELGVRSRALFDKAMDQRVPSKIASSCDGVVQVLQRDAGGWSLRATASMEPLPADVPGALELAGAVGRAKAEAWVAEADDGRFGLGDATCRLSLDYDDDAGARRVVLDFGGETPSGYYARVSGEPAVFVAPKSLRTAGARWLVDRSGLRVDPAALEVVTITKGKKTIELRRHDLFGASDAGAHAGALEVGDALSSLRAEGVVHVGPAAKTEGFEAPALDVRVRMTADAGRDLHFVVGDATLWDDQHVYLVRIEGVDATFAVARARLSSLFDAL